jgi:hypothetical protein
LTEDTDQGTKRDDALKLLLGRICCLLGLLFGAGGIVFSVLRASVNLSAGAVGIVLGLVGYFLGVRRLGAATIAVGVLPLSSSWLLQAPASSPA